MELLYAVRLTTYQAYATNTVMTAHQKHSNSNDKRDWKIFICIYTLHTHTNTFI